MNFISNFKNKSKETIGNIKGAISIWYVMTTVIVLMSIAVFIDVLGHNYTVNEVQGILDISGTGALHAGVDVNSLRREEADFFSPALARARYYELIGQSLNNNLGGYVQSMEIVDIQAVAMAPSTWGLGDTNIERPQGILDATVKVTVPMSSILGAVPQAEKAFYRSYNGENFSITYNGTNNEGERELLVRSVTRIVYDTHGNIREEGTPDSW